MPPSATKKHRDEHHLRREDVKPEDVNLKVRTFLCLCLCPELLMQIQNAFYLHLRGAWGSFEGNMVPELPSRERVAAFAANRYVSADDLDALKASLDGSYSNIVNGAIAAVDDLRKVASRTRSLIAKNILAMDEHFLHVIYSAIISAGLDKWRPDVLRNFVSMYNQVHELIAIKTFQAIAISHGYSRLSPNLTNLQNMKLLQRFYRNYVFSHIYKLAMKEMKAAGSVKQSIANTNTYKRRKEVGLFFF
jgi:hypothetical protein